jgi:hypothetical protein
VICRQVCNVLHFGAVVRLILLAEVGLANTTQDTRRAATPADPRAAILVWWTDEGQDRTSGTSKNFAEVNLVVVTSPRPKWR